MHACITPLKNGGEGCVQQFSESQMAWQSENIESGSAFLLLPVVIGSGDYFSSLSGC